MENNSLITTNNKPNFFRRLIQRFFKSPLIDKLQIVVDETQIDAKFFARNRLKVLEDKIKDNRLKDKMKGNVLDINSLDIESQIIVLQEVMNSESDRIGMLCSDDFIGNNDDKRERHNQAFDKVNSMMRMYEYGAVKYKNLYKNSLIKTIKQLQEYETISRTEMNEEAKKTTQQEFPYRAVFQNEKTQHITSENENENKNMNEDENANRTQPKDFDMSR